MKYTDENKKIQVWVRIALLYFVIAAIIGGILRISFITMIKPLDFNFLLHTHSHIAILGWVFSAFFVFLPYCFLSPKTIFDKKYNIQFILLQISLIGMLITFTWQGYAAFSIAFSTLHIIVSYWFIIFFILRLKEEREILKEYSLSLHFIYAALFFLFLSTLAPFSLIYITLNGLSHSDVFQQAIYFYLHFQYNGWFTFGLLGLLTWSLEKYDAGINRKAIKIAFWLLFFSCFPAYFLSLLGFNIGVIAKTIAGISGIVQLAAALMLFSSFIKLKNLVKNVQSIKILLITSLFSFIIKITLQLLSVVPQIYTSVFASRNVIIAYLHLTMLGFISSGILFWAGSENIMPLNSDNGKIGTFTFLLGFVLCEILLFYESLVFLFEFPVLQKYYYFLFATNVLIIIGVGYLYYNQTKKPEFKKF